MKKIDKKIFVWAGISIFFVSAFAPSNLALAQDVANRLVISASLDKANPNLIIITAKTYNLEKEVIAFVANPSEGIVFTPSDGTGTTGVCNAGYLLLHSCQVEFKSSIKNTYKITASNGTLNSNEISVKISDSGIKINNCPSRQIESEGKCVDVIRLLANPATALPNDPLTVTASVISSGGDTVSFFSDNGGTFSPKNSCVTEIPTYPNAASCTVKFSSGDVKTYNLSGSVKIDGQTYNSSKIQVMVAASLNPSEENCAKQKPPMDYDSNTKQCVKKTDLSYTPLAGLPGLPEGQPIDTSQSCAFGNYLNIIFKAVIGICAVLALIMIVFGGIEYMTGGTASEKSGGKDKILNAILGLVILLGSYALLNTLNPQLLNVCLNLKPVEIVVKPIVDFDVSGAQTYNGQPIKVNFDKEAYPAAKFAEQKTGVDRALVLAVFAQETNSGANTGKCNYQTANMNMKKDNTGRNELDYLKLIVGENNYQTINMSCSGGGSTHGGAIGYVQFLPSTWYKYRDQAAAILGQQPSAWNVNDALLMEAIYIKALGGSEPNEKSQTNAVCEYFGNCNNSNISCGNGIVGTYGQCVMGKKASIQQQIDAEIKAGKIEP